MAQKRENGQALVLIVVALIVIFGFAALAIDGGRLYSEKRRAQNAADAAAYAAASAFLHEQDWRQEGLAQAGLNGFVDTDSAQNLDKRLDVMVYNPPQDGPYAGNTEYFQVRIRAALDEALVQLVYRDGLEVSADAVARARPIQAIFPGDAIHATDPHECQAIKFHNSASLYVIGGNVFSNSDVTGAPASCYSIIQMGNEGRVIVEDGGIRSVGSQYFQVPPTADFRETNSARQETLAVPVPDCSHLHTRNDNTEPLEPGIYGGIRVNNGETFHMNPGMYCLDGDLVVNGDGSLESNEGGVFIVMRDGDIRFNGNGRIQLDRADALKDGSNQEWGGMLIYMLPENDGTISLSGGGNSLFRGTIYAVGPTDPTDPHDPRKCIVTGNSNSFAVSSSIYCTSIEIGGSVGFRLYYDELDNYRMWPLIEMAQ